MMIDRHVSTIDYHFDLYKLLVSLTLLILWFGWDGWQWKEIILNLICVRHLI